jgi:hypothetical protein
MTALKKCLLVGLLALAAAQAVFASGEASFPILGGEETLWIGNSLVGSKSGGLSGYVDAALQLHSPPLSHLYERELLWAEPLQSHYLNDGTYAGENTLYGNGIYTGWPTTWVNAVDAIRMGHPNGNPWNYVVLQCYDPDDLNANPANFFKYVRKFDLVARMYGAEPVLYMRWGTNPVNSSETYYNTVTNNLDANYTAIGVEIGAPVVPIAVIWRNLYQSALFEASDLWTDVIHPTGVGKGVSVYAFYSMMTHRSPIGLNFLFGDYTVSSVESRTGESFATIDNAIEQEVWNVISARESWDNPGYVTPSPSGNAVVFYDPAAGNLQVQITGQVKAVRIGCPQRTYLNAGANPLIDGKAADLKDSETMTWYKPAGFAAGTYNLGSIVTPGSPQNRIGYAFTPSSGRASGGIVQLMVVEPMPPSFTSDPILKPEAQENNAYSSSISGDAHDPNPGDTLTFSKLSGPSWLTVGSNGAISGTPGSGDVGINDFTVQVSDGTSGSDTAVLRITVAGYTPAPPSFTSDPLVKADVLKGTPYSGSIAADATDPNPTDVLTFSKIAGPAWLTVGADGTLSGTPGVANAGLNSFTVQVNDGNGGTDTATLEIYVTLYIPGGEIEVCDSGYVLAGEGGVSVVSFAVANSGLPGNYLVVAAVSEGKDVAAMTFGGVAMTQLHQEISIDNKVEIFGIATTTLSGTVNATYTGTIYGGTQIYGYAFLSGVDTVSPVRFTAGATVRFRTAILPCWPVIRTINHGSTL